MTGEAGEKACGLEKQERGLCLCWLLIRPSLLLLRNGAKDYLLSESAVFRASFGSFFFLLTMPFARCLRASVTCTPVFVETSALINHFRLAEEKTSGRGALHQPVCSVSPHLPSSFFLLLLRGVPPALTSCTSTHCKIILQRQAFHRFHSPRFVTVFLFQCHTAPVLIYTNVEASAKGSNVFTSDQIHGTIQ